MTMESLPSILFQVTAACCSADSEFTTIFANGSRSGTELFTFDTKQAEKIYYFIDYASGAGSGVLTLQVQNAITGNWEDVEAIGTFSVVAESLVVGILEPNNSLSRIQLVTTGSWTGSIGATLVDPKNL